MITLKNGDGIKWPHGKRIAVLLTFDFDAEYLRYSVTGQSALGFSDISRGQYGPHEGLKRCLDMLARQNIKTTFFVNMAKAEAILEAISGKKVIGHRAPLDTLQTYGVKLMQKRGYLYSSTLKDCDWAYIHEGEHPVVELPTEPGFDDFSFFYFSYADPAEYVYNMWKDAFDELANEGDKIMCLKLHPQLIGRSSRIRMLERLVLYMRQNGAWIAGCEEVARYVLAQNGKEADADAVAK